MTKPSELSPEAREALHLEAENRIAVFNYEMSQSSGKPKDVSILAQTPLVVAVVQVVREGGENNLHYHTNSDTLWTVLRGRVRFYGVNDSLLAELGSLESILMPGGARYWFEKIGSEDLVLQQIIAVDRSAGESQRINLDKHKAWMEGDAFLTVYDEPAGELARQQA
jgi:mannose-6-phosphate isomerase-like protein (cupin superfamily)